MPEPIIIGQPHVDATDPIFVLVSWVATWSVGKLSERYNLKQVRPYLPWVAAAVAMGLRALYDVVLQGGDLTPEAAMRAFATGAAAVWGHTAVRGVQKDVARRKRQKQDPEDGA